jgi:putative ABC transport system ATP-binding protein
MDALIVVEQLRKTYDLGEVTLEALRGIDLRMQRGEFVAIMGASGSGKSTFMNILGCLDRPSSGRYLLEGIDVSQLSSDALAEIRNAKIGFILRIIVFKDGQVADDRPVRHRTIAPGVPYEPVTAGDRGEVG